VTCAFAEWDRYGRFVGRRQRTAEASVAAWLVSTGHAMDWPRHSDGAYASYQDEARLAKRGIWRGEFEPAWEWRTTQQAAPKPEIRRCRWSSSAGTPVPAMVEGNISRSHCRKYHL